MTTEARRAYMRVYSQKHKDREREKRRARIAANPEKYRAAQRHKYYGVSPEEAKAMLLAQGSRCAICRVDKPTGRGFWHLDHDHVTGKVRGFLCHGCNNGLGFFKDDPHVLQLAAAYLKEHESDGRQRDSVALHRSRCKTKPSSEPAGAGDWYDGGGSSVG